MELDTKLKQYEAQNQNLHAESNISNKETPYEIKPYQNIIEYIQKHLIQSSYKELFSLLSSTQNNIQFTLDDGAQVIIGKTNGIINIAINYKDNSKFIASWTDIIDEKEYFCRLKEIN